MDGSQFRATWRRVEGEWMVQLEPRRRGGRLPKRGAVLSVVVHKRSGPAEAMTVRVVAEARDGADRPMVALAEKADKHNTAKLPRGRRPNQRGRGNQQRRQGPPRQGRR